MDRATRDSVTARAQTQLGLVTREQLEEMRVSESSRRAAVRRGELVVLYDRVYALAGAPPSTERDVLAIVLAVGEDAVASHLTAAAIHGVPGFSIDPHAVHVTVQSQRRPGRVPAILHYSRALPPNHVVAAAPIPVTSLARTIFDLARLCRRDRVERALDNMLAAGRLSVPAMERVVLDLAGSGRAGTVMMRELVVERGAGFVVPRSRLERRFLEIVRRFDLPKPRREVDLGTDEAWNGRVEFVFDGGVLVEIDGRRWHTSLTDQLADDDRDNVFRSAGFTVLRFRWRVLRDRPELVAQRVRAAIESAARRGVA